MLLFCWMTSISEVDIEESTFKSIGKLVELFKLAPLIFLAVVRALCY
jgi:hypothetical protein